jgi:hypothetical protein
MVGRTPAYRCRIGGAMLFNDESAGTNYSYPWRDNFCEHRYFYVGECPGGLGHQGQDIRPTSCKQRIEGAHRCVPYQHDVVAVRDGMVLRAPGQMPVYLFVNAPDEHIRFRYLHMFPRRLDDEGVVSGRLLREGEGFGKVGNFFQHEGATSYHLHFDMQVPTRYGWVFVNPYMTLVASYERLIGGRGIEVKDEPAAVTTPSASAPPGPDPLLLGERPGYFAVPSEGDDRVESANNEPSNQTAPVTAKGDASPRLGNRARPADAGAAADREGAVRPMDRGVSRASARTRYFRYDLFAGHARPKAGQHRF